MKRIQIVFHFNVIAEVADHLTKADLHGPQADYILSMKEKVTTDGIRLRGNNSFLMNKKKTFVWMKTKPPSTKRSKSKWKFWYLI